MLRFIIVVLLILDVLVWLPAIYRRPPNIADISCPARPAKPIRYPDGWRVPSCKPTGIDWSRR